MTADKMSRGCSKVYSRKLSSVSHTSIQFDKLFHENSNRPSAAKSAGTVGKWGVISCTSLRSSNFNTCRDDILSSKRMRLDYGSRNSQNSSQSKDPFSFETDGDKLLTEQNQQLKAVAKPKKFFKSRNVDLISGEDLRYYTGNKRSGSNYATQSGKKYCKGNFASKPQYDSATSESNSDSGSKKFFTATGSINNGDSLDQQIEAVNLSSPCKTTAPLREENKPPIVLRIFKGTSHLVSDVKESSSVPLPAKPSSENQGLNLRSTRRRHIEVDESWSSSLHDGKDRQAHVSITAPKKSSKIVKDKVAVQVSSTSNSVLSIVGCDSDVKSASSTSIANKYVSSDTSAENTFTDHEGRARSKDDLQSDTTNSYIGMGIMHDEKENISSEDVCETVKDRATPVTSITYCAQGAKTASGLDIRSYSESEQPQITNTADEEKLSQAEELLSSTYVDFRAATEKLLLEPKESCRPVLDDIDFSSSVITTSTTEVKEPCRLMLEVDFNTGMKLNSEEAVSDNLKREDFPTDTEAKDSCKTILDSIEFNTTSERLISEPKDSCKTILDLFTDSEDSNSIADQINTIASSQGEGEMENQARYKSTEEEKDAGVTEIIAPSHTVMQDSIVPEIECASGQVPSSSVSERTNSPATKKGSIFKSRSLLSDGSKKRLALYKHKWVDDGTGGFSQGSEQTSREESLVQPTGTTGSYSDAEEEFETPKLVRVVTWPMSNATVDEAKAVTSLKCNKTAKGYFTVIRNVKKAHQIQESGEFQEFNDDVEYILDALQDNNPVGTRCLSAITLASKCMAPAFRMHVRAHGTVAKFFRALHDAAKDQSLALCTATVMFVLSQDRLNMDLDRDSLELMLNLLESDASHHNALEYCGMSSTQLHKNKKKVRELCAEIQSQGHAKHLNLDNITVGQLAMETLLSLTSRRAGEWFKEELRELGGLEHIVKTINDCCTQVDDYIVEWKEPLLDKLRKLDRCLRVLENVTNQNEENQLYLLKYENGILIDTLARLYKKCDGEIVMYPVTSVADKESPGVVIHELLLTVLKVLINLTHSFSNTSVGSSLVGGRPGIIDASLHVLLQVPCYVPEEKKFDLLVLVLIFLINLVEHSTSNRKLLFESKAPSDPDSIFHSSDERTAVEALISLFYQHEELARVEGIKTDAILDGKNDSEPESELPKSTEEFIEETVAKLLQKAGRNMEHTLIGSYLGLLIGYLITDNKEYEMFVRQCLPQNNFSTMISVLEKVYNFMNLASAISSSRGITQTRRIINYLEQSDAAALSAKTASMEDSQFHLTVLQPPVLKDA